jgi:lipid-A-disaccharide synthase
MDLPHHPSSSSVRHLNWGVTVLVIDTAFHCRPDTNVGMRLLISAGEASGEMYGAQLIPALRRRIPDLDVAGVGGDHMRQAGCRILVDSSEVAVVGLAEVVRHLPRIYSRFRHLLRAVDSWKPEAAVLIDFPDFNFRLARALDRRGIPVIYYISPQLWAWRSGRIKLVRRYVRKMLVIFPFEESWYRQRGVEAEFVGHPLCDQLAPAMGREEFASACGLNVQKTWIALLPGSRQQEFSRIAPTLLAAAHLLQQEPNALTPEGYEFLIPVASTLNPQWTRQFVPGGLPVTFTGDARQTLLHSRAAAVASGTATVQAALAGTPFAMVYRVSRLTWAVGRHLVSVPHYAMVNLIAQKRVVPELVQAGFTAGNVASELQSMVRDGPERAQMLEGLRQVRQALCPSLTNQPAIERAAAAVLRGLKA